ncbi:MAG: hypothetical protein ACP5MD_03380, partial [Verrucomicrobiia bacterium]
MTSHEYQTNLRETAQVVLGPILALTLIGALLHLLSQAGALPAPWPMLDMDRTILLHQSWAASQRHNAQMLFVGDSSCLMNVDTPQLSAMLAKPTLNLATFSYVDLESHALLIKRFAQTNPDQLDTIVLLIHPQTLRLGEPSTHHTTLLRTALSSQPPNKIQNSTIQSTPPSPWIHNADLLGINLVRERLFGRLIPIPLPGQYGRVYGFTHDLWHKLTAQQGSLVDPHSFDPAKTRANTEYRIAPRFQKEAQLFRQTCPPTARIAVGLTPIPASIAQPDNDRVYREMLNYLGRCLDADILLTELPTTMPDAQFAS